MVAKDKLIDYLTEFVLSLDFESISEKSLDRVKTIILHDLSIGLCSLDDSPYQIASKIAGRFKSYHEGSFTLIGNGKTNSQEEAVFLNAMLMSTKAQEDFCGALHLGPIVISAALTAAEASNASGQEFLTAVAAGFETGLSMGDIFGVYTAKRGLRGTPLFGQVGATMAVGKLLGLTIDKLKSAFSHAVANVSGTAESLLAGTTEWHFHAGWAAKKALWAAHLAADGLKGSPNALYGRAGFVQAFGGPETILRGSVHTAERIPNVGLKRYPVNIFVMSPLEGALRIAKSIPKESRPEVKRVTIEVNENEATFALLNATGPFDLPAQGILSASYCVAVALLRGEFNRALVDELAKDSLTVETAKKVIIKPSRHLSPLTARITVEADRSEYREDIMDIDDLYYKNFDNEQARLQVDLQSINADSRVPEMLAPFIRELESKKRFLSVFQVCWLSMK